MNRYRPSISRLFSGRWSLPTGSINRWIGIDIQVDVGTISHHSCDHDSFVHVYPGPFLINSGTIWDHKSWSFFSWVVGKRRPGPKAKRFKRHTRKTQSNVTWLIHRPQLESNWACIQDRIVLTWSLSISKNILPSLFDVRNPPPGESPFSGRVSVSRRPQKKKNKKMDDW